MQFQTAWAKSMFEGEKTKCYKFLFVLLLAVVVVVVVVVIVVVSNRHRQEFRIEHWSILSLVYCIRGPWGARVFESVSPLSPWGATGTLSCLMGDLWHWKGTLRHNTLTHRRLNILTNRCRCPTNPNCPYWWLRECTIAQMVLHFYQLSNSFCLVLAASMVCLWQPLVGCSDSFSIFSTTPFFQAGWRMDGLAPPAQCLVFGVAYPCWKCKTNGGCVFFGGRCKLLRPR